MNIPGQNETVAEVIANMQKFYLHKWFCLNCGEKKSKLDSQGPHSAGRTARVSSVWVLMRPTPHMVLYLGIGLSLRPGSERANQMSEEIELASPAELAKLQTLYLNKTPEPTERARQLAKINEEYAASEEKRRAARPWAKRPADRAARDKAEDERFERAWKKFEDPTYYGLQVRRRSKTE